MAEEDLKCEILELKKRLHTISSENYLLKVRVRKLQTEVDKKERQIECLLDPRKSTCIQKIISERGATMIINLKQRNSELEEVINAKDAHIKKLQTVIQTSKLYTAKNCENKHLPLKDSNSDFQKPNNNRFRSQSLCSTPVPPKQPYFKSGSDIQLDYVKLAQNLQKIRSANSETRASTCRRPLSQTALSDKVKTSRKDSCTFPKVVKAEHTNAESKKIGTYLTNLLDEMEKMKETISQLSIEQEQTRKILRDKNRNIEILAKKVKSLQRSKLAKSPISKYSLPKFENRLSESISTNKNQSGTTHYSQDSFEEATTTHSSSKMKGVYSYSASAKVTRNENSTEVDREKSEADEKSSDNYPKEEENDDDDDVETGDSP